MYLVDIRINKTTNNEGLQNHRAWFNKHFQSKDFLIVGPSKTFERAGIIIAKDMPREQLKQIIAEDVFYTNGGEYSINQFTARLVNSDINKEWLK